jgi:hypothetical protein
MELNRADKALTARLARSSDYSGDHVLTDEVLLKARAFNLQVRLQSCDASIILRAFSQFTGNRVQRGMLVCCGALLYEKFDQ